MNITIIGTGYVGLVSGACFADIGNNVLCIDKNEQKIDDLKKREMPFYEPGLKDKVRRNCDAGRLCFSSNLDEGLAHGEIAFACVDTPMSANGEADLTNYNAMLDGIGRFLAAHPSHNFILVNKSTVPVGTAEYGYDKLCSFREGGIEVVSCPEFLREGSAVNDFLHPDRIVIGIRKDSPMKVEIKEKLLSLFAEFKCAKVVVDAQTSELIKYAANAFLATKISFINEIANVCERVGADVNDVAHAVGLDTRIGREFLRAGLGYGGSCFPKDVRALDQIAGKSGYDFKLLKSVIEVNQAQRRRIIEKQRTILGNFKDKKIAVLGLAFKQNTDDIRESPAIEIINILLEEGALVMAFDYQAGENAKRVIIHENFTVAEAVHEVFPEADLVFIATEWRDFADLDWESIALRVRSPIIIDGKNLLDKKQMNALGWKYYGVGC